MTYCWSTEQVSSDWLTYSDSYNFRTTNDWHPATRMSSAVKEKTHAFHLAFHNTAGWKRKTKKTKDD